MGVNLTELVPATQIKIEQLQDRILAVDAMNTLYQFLTVIRQYDGTPLMDDEGRVTSHLSGLISRVIYWVENGIRPVFVFDGESPELKQKENLQRHARREAASIEYERLKKEGMMDKAQSKAIQSTRLTDELILGAQDLLKALGIPFLRAPSEGEAQAAYMNLKGQVYGIISQDYDSLLFGADKVIKNLSVGGRKKVHGQNVYVKIAPEMIERQKVLEALKFNQEQLIWLSILVGTDFNPGGIKGVGPKKALKLVSESSSLEEVLSKVEWAHENDPYEILRFFEKPPTIDADFSFSAPNERKIHELLVEKHNFSKDNVDKQISRLANARKNSQTGLERFFDK